MFSMLCQAFDRAPQQLAVTQNGHGSSGAQGDGAAAAVGFHAAILHHLHQQIVERQALGRGGRWVAFGRGDFEQRAHQAGEALDLLLQPQRGRVSILRRARQRHWLRPQVSPCGSERPILRPRAIPTKGEGDLRSAAVARSGDVGRPCHNRREFGACSNQTGTQADNPTPGEIC